MSKLSMGLNVSKKPSLASRPPPAKRKPIFDNDDSDAEDEHPTSKLSETLESITTFDGNSTKPYSKTTSSKPSPSSSKTKSNGPPAPPVRPLNKPTPTENISSKYTSTKHAKQAETLDPTIYDYDSIYDAMKAPTALSNNSTSASSQPKYLPALKAAAEIRKRDQIRAQDRKTAREREAEGDEFKDKEAFVTGAYKRQQAELRRAEEEERVRDGVEDERRRREGGAGMKAFYRGVLDRGEERHEAALRVVEERKMKGEEVPLSGGPDDEEGGKMKEKSEIEIAREKGATVNEEGEVVDKRELLQAGLNAGSAAKVSKPVVMKPGAAAAAARRKGKTQRERETREFEEQLLGKHGLSSDDEEEEDARASKSRRMEDELMKGLESP